jgi:hypothetical protein
MTINKQQIGKELERNWKGSGHYLIPGTILEIAWSE